MIRSVLLPSLDSVIVVDQEQNTTAIVVVFSLKRATSRFYLKINKMARRIPIIVDYTSPPELSQKNPWEEALESMNVAEIHNMVRRKIPIQNHLKLYYDFIHRLPEDREFLTYFFGTMSKEDIMDLVRSSSSYHPSPEIVEWMVEYQEVFDAFLPAVDYLQNLFYEAREGAVVELVENIVNVIGYLPAKCSVWTLCKLSNLRYRL